VSWKSFIDFSFAFIDVKALFRRWG